MKTVAIFGVGLIGGSFALALRRAGFPGRIVGVSSPEAIHRAIELGVIDEGMQLPEAAESADLLYLAQPICRILETLPLLDPHVRPSALITDAGSTKTAVLKKASESIHRCQFLGGHPLAGKEVRGVDSADAGLFQGRTYVLTPASEADLRTPAARTFLDWLPRIGAVPLTMDAASHDRTLANTSHLPQLASTALAYFLGKQDENTRQIFGPALLDSTRLALSPFDIWVDIVGTNRSEIAAALGGYISILDEMLRNLNPDEMQQYFSQGSSFARGLRGPH